MTREHLVQDLRNVQLDGFRLAPTLRTVAAMNPDASQVEFVAAMVSAGVHPNTAAKQFRQARQEQVENGMGQLNKDGTFVEFTWS